MPGTIHKWIYEFEILYNFNVRNRIKINYMYFNKFLRINYCVGQNIFTIMSIQRNFGKELEFHLLAT